MGFYFQPYLGKIPILTNIFQVGWNQQLVFFYLLEVDVDDVAKVVQKLFARLLFGFLFEILQIDGWRQDEK